MTAPTPEREAEIRGFVRDTACPAGEECCGRSAIVDLVALLDAARAERDRLAAAGAGEAPRCPYVYTREERCHLDAGHADAHRVDTNGGARLFVTPVPDGPPHAVEDAPAPEPSACRTCVAEGEANEDGTCSCGPECPDCRGGAK